MADNIECPLCWATEPYLYGDGGRALTASSMSSITHDEKCPYTIINSLEADTCRGCIYLEKANKPGLIDTCELGVQIPDDYDGFPDLDFGCNKCKQDKN